ncbi:tRNA pseudouridine(55) synthase TruB [Solimonas marina]|uniref:tRNA pseudouridine synthase B n=1 Tax=Solimonas marina TaxID=2714601 RepID=A0A970B6C6_9GAMM|nr:tRNA pseudouridine(55) synthase TruB [Solimonas marina]NKF22643.1 tRNA pseudouridine(55) synthase TruB [Solimonas marina]
MAVSVRPPRPPRRRLDGILLLDKPLGLSSNDALQRAKRLYRAEKAGHTGALDPLATGMLPICFGEATKLSGVLLDSDKEYRAVVKVGERSSTGDAEGEIVERSDATQLTLPVLQDALAGFLGPQLQVPPMYSALKRDGRPLYELARAGETVEREARPVTIAELELLDFAGDRFEIRVRCSKGTYIRTLAEDICRAVGQCGHLIGLRRTAVTPFWGRAGVTLDRLEASADDLPALDLWLLGPEEALRHWPSATLDDVRAQAFLQGRAQRLAGVPRESRIAVSNERGVLLGIAQSDAEGWLRPQRCFAPPRQAS